MLEIHIFRGGCGDCRCKAEKTRGCRGFLLVKRLFTTFKKNIKGAKLLVGVSATTPTVFSFIPPKKAGESFDTLTK